MQNHIKWNHKYKITYGISSLKDQIEDNAEVRLRTNSILNDFVLNKDPGKK